MKTEEEISKIAKELCPRTDAECAVFISGFVLGWKTCLKEEFKNGEISRKDI